MSESTDILHYGANERRAIMLGKLGGKQVLKEAVDKFYDRQVLDERLAVFFRSADLSILKWHYLNLMSIAFTQVPDDFDMERMILHRHVRLFDEGLSEVHFDIVMRHFRDTLEEMDVDAELIDEAMSIILPVRFCFAKGAVNARRRRLSQQRQRLMVSTAVIGVALFGAFSLARRARVR